MYNEKKNRTTPREWFVVPLEIIDEVISLIISGGVIITNMMSRVRR